MPTIDDPAVTDPTQSGSLIALLKGLLYGAVAEDNTNGVLAVARKPLAVATYAPSNAKSAAYEASRVIKATPGVLYRLNVYSSLGASQWIQLHNATSLPADTAVPDVIATILTIANLSLDFGPLGRYFSTGIVVCNSTTGPTKTIGAANCWFDAQYA